MTTLIIKHLFKNKLLYSIPLTNVSLGNKFWKEPTQQIPERLLDRLKTNNNIRHTLKRVVFERLRHPSQPQRMFSVTFWELSTSRFPGELDRIYGIAGDQSHFPNLIYTHGGHIQAAANSISPPCARSAVRATAWRPPPCSRQRRDLREGRLEIKAFATHQPEHNRIVFRRG